MKMKRVYICTDSITGIFSAIYDAWIERAQCDLGIVFHNEFEQELFCEYIKVEETQKKTLAVERMIQKNLGVLVYQDIYQAMLAHDADKGTAILGVLLEAQRIPNSCKIMEHLTNPHVEKIFELSRRVGAEAHQYKGFIRFRELKNGILLSEIEPKSQVLPCIAEHFSDRLPLENFMIYDRTHEVFVVHQAKSKWVLVKGEKVKQEALSEVSDEQVKFEGLWREFCQSISIRERENLWLQRQNLPLRYRKHMVK